MVFYRRSLTRRDFIHAGCALTAAAAFSFDPVQRVEARVRGSASSTSFNGGKSQLNLNWLTYGEYPFADAMLYSNGWVYGSGTANANGMLHPSIIDGNGMPITRPSGGVQNSTTVPASVARPGNYVVRTIGSGTYTVTNSASPLPTASFSGFIANGVLNITSAVTGTIGGGQALVGADAGSCIGRQLTSTTYQINNYLTGMASKQTLGSAGSPVAFTTSNGNTNAGGFISVTGTGRYVFYPGDSAAPKSILSSLSAIGSPYISKFAVMHVDDEMAWVNDPYAFHPKFKERLRTGGFGILRDLNWAGMNLIAPMLNNSTTWETRKTLTYNSFAADEVRQNLFASGGANHSSGSVISISSISYSSGTVTVVTSSPHGQTGTFNVSIDGCLRNDGATPTFNGTFTATVVDATTFTYPLTYIPVTPTTLGTANIGVFSYAISFGSGPPVDKQTVQFYFDALATADAKLTSLTFSAPNTCNWSDHTFVGGEMVAFDKDYSNNYNLPTNVGMGQTYYVLAAGLVPGVSFQFSATPGGPPVSFSNVPGSQTGVRLITANLNGTGEVPLFNVNCTPLLPTANYNAGNGTMPSPRTRFGQPSLCTAVYDVALNAWLVMGGTLAGGHGILNGVPPEIFIKLCNELGAHPMFALPQFTLDPMTDYVPNLFALVRSTASWMMPIFECGNEVWNSIYSSSGYGRALAFKYWNVQFGANSFDEKNWLGKVNSTLGQVLAQMAGQVGAGYRMIIAVQTVGFANPGSNGFSHNFVSTKFVSQSQGTQTLSVPALGLNITFAKSPAYLYATHGSGANYISPGNYLTFPTATFIANYAICTASVVAGVMNVASLKNGVGTLKVGQEVTDDYGQFPPGTTIASFGTGSGGVGTYNLSNNFSCLSTRVTAINSTAKDQVNQFIDGLTGADTLNYTNAEVLKFFTNLYNYCQTLVNNAGKPLGVMPYEGGYGPDYDQGAVRNALFEAGKKSPDLGLCLTTGGLLSNGQTINGNYKDLVALGVDFPSALLLAGANFPWTLADPDLYAIPELPSFTAIAAFNAS